MNRSEEIFEEFCRGASISFRRLGASAAPSVQSPDYEIVLAEETIVVEVKEFQANAEEAKLRQDFFEGKLISPPADKIPDPRIQRKIRKGSDQIKARTMGQMPGILVLIDFSTINQRRTDPYFLFTAMRGAQVVYLNSDRVSSDSSDGAVGPAANRSLSAIGVLWQAIDGEWQIAIYHNEFTSAPLNDSVLRHPRIRQFRRRPIPVAGSGWEEIGVEQSTR